MRFCRCGAITKKGLCEKCRPNKDAGRKKTAERGYDNRWRALSERQREQRSICEVCDAKGIATPATELHHIEKIKDAPHLRLSVGNTLSVCGECHEEVEGMGPTELAKYLEKLESEAA